MSFTVDPSGSGSGKLRISFALGDLNVGFVLAKSSGSYLIGSLAEPSLSCIYYNPLPGEVIKVNF